MYYLNKSGLAYLWSKITSAINSETTARQSADTTLSNRITTLEGNELSVSVNGEILEISKGGNS